MKLKETFKMKINSKLMLITATLGLMAAASVTAFGDDSYVYFTNNSTQTIDVSSNWIGNAADGNIHRIVSSCTLNPGGGNGKLDIQAGSRIGGDGDKGFSGHFHVKFNGHNEDMLIVQVDCHYSNGGGLTYSHLQHAYIGTSAPEELNAMGITETLYGAVQPSGTTQNCGTETPGQLLYGVNNKYVSIVINNANSSTTSPMMKISNIFKAL